MARLATSSLHPDATSGKSLFESMSDHYLSIPEVRNWLFRRECQAPVHGGLLDRAFSYACMYYPPPFVPKGEAPYPLPKPFLDLGDFLVCQHLHDGIVLGTMFNQNEKHALSSVRDSMLSSPELSSRPRTRNFAVDLKVKQLEIFEFAWMDDDSLIVACRRMHPSSLAPEAPMVLSADLLFFSVLPPGDILNATPLMRMTLTEKPALCQFCGAIGIRTCKCPPPFKTRASASRCQPYPSTSPNVANPNRDYYTYEQQDPKILQMAMQCWPKYAQTKFRLNEHGNFFCSWFLRSADGTKLVPSYSYRHPVPYQFVTGTKKDTMRLTSLYVQRLRLIQKTMAADLRLTPPAIANPMESARSNAVPVRSHYGVRESSTSLISVPYQDSAQSNVSHPSTLSLSELDRVSLNGRQEASPSASACTKRATAAVIASEQFHTSQPTKRGKPVKAPIRQNRMRATMSEAAKQAKKEKLKQFMANNVIDNRKCIPCNKTFSKRSNLVRHIETGHFALRPFQCEACPKKFGHSNHLRRHIEKLHAHTEGLHI